MIRSKMPHPCGRMRTVEPRCFRPNSPLATLVLMSLFREHVSSRKTGDLGALSSTAAI